MNVRFLNWARAELRETVGYYENQHAGLGHQFRDEVFEAVERIKRYPEAWAKLSENTRRCRTRRFPHGIIYEISNSEILIVAVAHMHRRPGYWLSRK